MTVHNHEMIESGALALPKQLRKCTTLWTRNAEEGMQAFKQAEHCSVTATPNITLEKKLLCSDCSHCTLL